ncbi:hypothetical protein AAFF_G00377750 [Aldrovandia affinis]|uniref:Uncharacterized protein n=1 Tax=Aldrovandia affinis TaxID=143900 RepID=A0AAD7WMT3_9TELE|nr:hypothetical protein AAFF_G00377750 [Aldrovandia affinis]
MCLRAAVARSRACPPVVWNRLGSHGVRRLATEIRGGRVTVTENLENGHASRCVVLFFKPVSTEDSSISRSQRKPRAYGEYVIREVFKGPALKRSAEEQAYVKSHCYSEKWAAIDAERCFRNKTYEW